MTALSVITVLLPWLLGWPNYSDAPLALPIALAAVVAWPLLQRVFTEEPSVEREPEGFRAARSASTLDRSADCPADSGAISTACKSRTVAGLPLHSHRHLSWLAVRSSRLANRLVDGASWHLDQGRRLHPSTDGRRSRSRLSHVRAVRSTGPAESHLLALRPTSGSNSCHRRDSLLEIFSPSFPIRYPVETLSAKDAQQQESVRKDQIRQVQIPPVPDLRTPPVLGFTWRRVCSWY